MTVKEDLRQQLENGLSELKTMRDEIRVKLHLAGMEAKTKWEEELEPGVHEMERQVKEAGGDALHATKEGLDKLRDSFQTLREKLD